jgi:hypothetical protein
VREAVLAPGDALLLPQSWLHQVTLRFGSVASPLLKQRHRITVNLV